MAQPPEEANTKTPRRERVCRAIRIAGLVVCAILAVTWAASAFVRLTILTNVWAVEVGDGGISIMSIDWLPSRWWGWRVMTVRPSQGLAFHLGLRWPSFEPRSSSLWAFTHIPIWLLFVMTYAMTGVVTWPLRWHPGRGTCRRCGYNLTGNTSGRCPECGTKTDPRRG